MLATKTDKYSEQELVALLKLNHKAAFEYLYDNYSSALYGIIFKIVRHEEKAADIMQEVFLKIWRKIGDYYHEKGSLYTWMLNIARNSAIDLIRKEKNIFNLDIENHVGVLDNENNDSLNINTIDLKNIVDTLEPERKILLDLVYLQGYTQQEAAEKLDIPLGTAKSRIRLALQQLKLYYAA
jgi:RNA polymerase sigma factor (sigma-70 family)